MTHLRCPHCRTPLDGGPVVFHCCHTCERRVQAADIDLEYTPPTPAAA